MCVFFFKQKPAYEMRMSYWSSDVCSSDLKAHRHAEVADEMKVEKGQQLYRLPRLQRERIYHDIFHDLIAQEDGCRGDHAELSVVCLDGHAVFLLPQSVASLNLSDRQSVV